MARVKDTQYVNPQDVYNYLISEKGLSREHALGMLANIQAESGFNVSIQEGGKAAGTGGVGLFQHTGPRRTALMKYTGGDISNWKSQVDFALQESPSQAYLSKTFSTPEEASTWFTTQWERPANASAQAKSRLSNINKFSNFTQYESTGNDGIANGERKFQVMLGDTPTYISLEDFNAELEKVKKAEEKTEKSADRKEVDQAKTKEQSFLEAMNTLYSNSSQNNSQAGAEDQQMGTQGAGYEPLDIPQQQSSLPTLPSLFSTAIPEMVDGGPVYTYAERPGSYYQKTNNGKWLISNDGTGGKYVPVQDSGEYIELDLTPEEIQEYAKGGFIVEHLDEYAEGGQSGCPPGYTKVNGECKKVKPNTKKTNFDKELPPLEMHGDYNEFLKRRAAYDDSLSLFNLTNAQQKIASVNKDFKLMTPQQKKDYYYRNHYNHWQAGTTGINPRFFGQDEGSSKIVKVKDNITKNNLKAADTDYYHPTIKPYRHYVNPFSITENFLYKKPKQPVNYKMVDEPTVNPIIPIKQPQPPIQDNYPPPPPFNGVEPFIQGDPIPMYATPDPGAEFVPDTERYIDWNGNSIGFNGIRFRKPGHGGDLIKKGRRHYLHYPSIETRNSADIIPEENEFAEGGIAKYPDGGQPRPVQGIAKPSAPLAIRQLQDTFSDKETIWMLNNISKTEDNKEELNTAQDGGSVYTYAERPGSYYQKTGDGKWMISNSGTGGQYVPVQDPTGERSAALNKGAVIYNRPVQEGVKPAPLQFTGNINQPVEPAYNPLYTNPNARYSETTQQVASKLVPQTQQGRQDLEFVKQNNANRKADVETFLTTQGNTPEQAAQIVGSYCSDWTDLESKYATDIRTMKQTAATISQGVNPYSMQEFVPRAAQPLGEKVEDIIFNPFTSAGYAVRGQAIPDYMGEKLDNGTLGYYANGQFVQGRNLLDNVIDVATPIGWAHSGKNIAERATNDVSGDFWTEENAWDALNVLPGLGFTKAAKAVKGLEAANSTTSLARLGNNVLDLAERAQLTRTKPQLIESAIDVGSIAREPFYAPQRTSLFNPGTPIDAETGLYNPLPNPEIPQINPRTGLFQVNNTVGLSTIPPRNFKETFIVDYKSAEGLPEDQLPYLMPQEEMMTRYPWLYTSKDQAIMDSFKSRFPNTTRPAEIPATANTQEDIFARALGRPLPTRVSFESLQPKTYYNLNGDIIQKPYGSQKDGGYTKDFPWFL